MRRAHCEIMNETEIIRRLESETIGTLGTVDADGHPYLMSVNYALVDGCICFHSALKGEKLDNIARSPKVGFMVHRPLAYIDSAFSGSLGNLHQFYWSVSIRGEAEVVEDFDRKVMMLNALVASHEPGSHPDVSEHGNAVRMCAVVAIHPESMTCKADLGQNRTEAARKELARYLTRRNHLRDHETVYEMGFDPEAFRMPDDAAKGDFQSASLKR